MFIRYCVGGCTEMVLLNYEFRAIEDQDAGGRLSVMSPPLRFAGSEAEERGGVVRVSRGEDRRMSKAKYKEEERSVGKMTVSGCDSARASRLDYTKH
ncbi:hypothetical protein GOBAR_DD13821 [Gossypium barbadense]|nr:hypothetical protein GOBAR_DD13821 [Gossypium barbadense]